MHEEDLVSIGEAARIMDVSIDTLRRWDKSGRLNPFKSSGGTRLYSKTQIEFESSELINLAKDWTFEGVEIQSKYYSSTSSIFQARLSTLQSVLSLDGELRGIFPLIVAIAGEIGNNSFDHNLGNWPSVTGVFFGYNISNKVIVLADRGLGILTTLKKVKPELGNDLDALKVAFSEVVSGRAPESRGNGLKFVRKVIGENPMGLIFQSGNAILDLVKDGDDLKINRAFKHLNGCLALITF